MKRTLIVLSILGLLFLLLLEAKIKASLQFRTRVAQLFAASKYRSGQRYQKNQIASLPEPVQRYFNHVLKEGQPYISYVKMKHEGLFKADLKKGWMRIKGEQYVSTAQPGFIWKGTTAMFVAQDLYIADQGRLIVTLFSLLRVVDGKGPQYDQGELLRWLGESILYPTNFLPSDKLHWFPIDATTAKLTFEYQGLSLFFVLTFNAKGEITEMKTERYMDLDTLATWVIKVSDYKKLNRMLIPTRFEILWRLAAGDFSYAKFDITTLVYDQPTKF
jgi:hypothetical protein